MQAGNTARNQVYIQYDKAYYVAGETIWFKAYLFQNRKPDGLTNNFYIQLFDKEGHHIITKKYPVQGAAVRGDLQLPDSLPQGYYTIRAVTPAMLNQPVVQSFYQKEMFVFNPSTAITETGTAKKSALNIRFYPESGYLADGILMNIAFECTDSLGRPVDVSGYIKTNDTTVVAPFKTLHDGMGRVQFKPYAARKYIALVTVNGEPRYFPLPDVIATGINLRVEDEKGGKVFTLSRTVKNKQEYDHLTLLAGTDEGMVYENQISFDNYLSVKGHIITDSLPSGPLWFTVLNKEGLPVAERTCFINNNEYRGAATAQIAKKGTGAREENNITVTFPEIIQRSCSVSVTALTGNDPVCADNIISSVLLQPAIKGNVSDAAWYFNDTSAATRLALDNLMLVQGWSQISLRKTPAAGQAGIQAEDNYLLRLTGYLKDAKTKTPVSGGRLGLFFESEDSVNHSYEVTVDAAGHFIIDSLLFRGEIKLYYGYTSSKGKEQPADIFLESSGADILVTKLDVVRNAASADINTSAATGNIIADRYRNSLSKLQETKTLDPVVVKSVQNKRPLDEVNEKYTKGVFTALGKVNIDNVNEPEINKALSVFDFIRRSVKQVMVEDERFVNVKNKDLFLAMSDEQFHKKEVSIDSANNRLGGTTPGDVLAIQSPKFREPGKHFEVAVFLNEHPAFAGALKTITMNDVALIKYYEPGFIGAGGADGPGGALAIYTKNEIPAAPAGLEKLDYIICKGYAIERKFYSPDYALPSTGKTEPDYRTTLYWNPDLYTNETSPEIKIRYFNSDISNRMRVILEGFDVNGKLVHIEKIIE